MAFEAKLEAIRQETFDPMAVTACDDATVDPCCRYRQYLGYRACQGVEPFPRQDGRTVASSDGRSLGCVGLSRLGALFWRLSSSS